VPAPVGTVTTRVFVDADVIVAVVVPNVTVSCEIVVLKPDPEIVTGVPTGPDTGEKLISEICVEE
jgi:hypothetical protein